MVVGYDLRHDYCHSDALVDWNKDRTRGRTFALLDMSFNGSTVFHVNEIC